MKDFNFGQNLRQIRQAKGISQEAMALWLNISQSTYSRIENKPTIPNEQLLNGIAKILDVSPFELLPECDESNNDKTETISTSSLKKIISLLQTPFGDVIAMASGLLFTSAVYEMAKGFCNEFGSSHRTSLLVRGLAALLAAAFFYYWIKKFKEMD